MSMRANEIIQAVADEFDVGSAEILGRSRHKSVATARKVAMRLLRDDGRWSYPEIGRFVGGRDHGTVISACRSVQRQVVADEALWHRLERLREKLRDAETARPADVPRLRVAV